MDVDRAQYEKELDQFQKEAEDTIVPGELFFTRLDVKVLTKSGEWWNVFLWVTNLRLGMTVFKLFPESLDDKLEVQPSVYWMDWKKDIDFVGSWKSNRRHALQCRRCPAWLDGRLKERSSSDDGRDQFVLAVTDSGLDKVPLECVIETWQPMETTGKAGEKSNGFISMQDIHGETESLDAFVSFVFSHVTHVSDDQYHDRYGSDDDGDCDGDGEGERHESRLKFAYLCQKKKDYASQREELFGTSQADERKHKFEDPESTIFRKEFESLEHTLQISEESRQKGQISLVELERQTEQIHRALDLVDDVHHSLSIGDRKHKFEDPESTIFRKEFESLEHTLQISEESRQKGQISLVELERQTEQIHRALDLVDDVHHSLSIGDRILDTMSTFGNSLLSILVGGNGRMGRKREHYHGGFHRRSDEPRMESAGYDDDIASSEESHDHINDGEIDDVMDRQISKPEFVHRPRVLSGLLSQRNSSGQYKYMPIEVLFFHTLTRIVDQDGMIVSEIPHASVSTITLMNRPYHVGIGDPAFAVLVLSRLQELLWWWKDKHPRVRWIVSPLNKRKWFTLVDEEHDFTFDQRSKRIDQTRGKPTAKPKEIIRVEKHGAGRPGAGMPRLSARERMMQYESAPQSDGIVISDALAYENYLLNQISRNLRFMKEGALQTQSTLHEHERLLDEAEEEIDKARRQSRKVTRRIRDLM
eukprot:TRINITY_DN13861_c0_g1_i2.p1 TRINITY_DN13861_c0_g1~~TRINITY_DN13861_c0_g1_i2.p1  ORF type:complete len:728 (+),score=199.46 TRINITY_DN13861_c0_g1_i2:80-2185(+)